MSTVFVAISVCGQITLSVNPSNYNGYNVTCFGAADGSIELTVSGGTAPYTYTWSTGATTQDVSDLRAGFIAVVVQDAANTNARAELTLTEPHELMVDAVPYVYGTGYNVSCFSCYNGSVAVTASDGVPPYTYLWSDGATTEDRTQLDAGSYEVYVTDANGCLQKSGGLVLTQPERDDWTKSGNAGTVPGTHYIGTSDNKDVVFKSNGQEALRLKSNGEIKLSGALNSYGLLFRDQNGILRAGTFPNIPLLGGAPCKDIGAFPPYWTTQGNNFDLLCQEQSPVLGTLDARPLDIVTAGQQRVQVDTLGRVAIGAQDPADQLEVHTALARSGLTLNNVREDDNAHTEIRFKKNHEGRYALGCDFEGTGDQDFFLWDHVAGLNRLRVDAAGRVLIGNAVAQSSPLYKLYVEGGIVSRDVKVTAQDFPDYVFDEHYTLMPLTEVARFIDAHGHLPHMPSAAEIAANAGVEVGDLQLRLLRTVEEQQLYILELREELTAVKQRLVELETR